MRYLAAVALAAAHVALLAIPEKLLAPEPASPRRPPVAAVTMEVLPATVAVPAESADSLTLTELDQLGAREDSLMLQIQEHGENVDAIVELAYLYLRHGWSDRAIGPLARAVEVAPTRDELRYELRLAVKLSGRAPESVDPAAEAREFLEIVAMWGHSC